MKEERDIRGGKGQKIVIKERKPSDPHEEYPHMAHCKEGGREEGARGFATVVIVNHVLKHGDAKKLWRRRLNWGKRDSWLEEEREVMELWRAESGVTRRMILRRASWVASVMGGGISWIMVTMGRRRRKTNEVD